MLCTMERFEKPQFETQKRKVWVFLVPISKKRSFDMRLVLRASMILLLSGFLLPTASVCQELPDCSSYPSRMGFVHQWSVEDWARWAKQQKDSGDSPPTILSGLSDESLRRELSKVAQANEGKTEAATDTRQGDKPPLPTDADDHYRGIWRGDFSHAALYDQRS